MDVSFLLLPLFSSSFFCIRKIVEKNISAWSDAAVPCILCISAEEKTNVSFSNHPSSMKHGTQEKADQWSRFKIRVH